MKIHGMCLVKNEADVIEECLRAAVKWCDYIYVWDNGSTDDTWTIVRRLSAELPQIVAWKKLDKPFKDGLRSEIFNAFKGRARPGDWWARLDADEFYVHDPKSFLAAVDRRYGSVWYAPLTYYFSSTAADEYERQPDLYADSVPVADRCRYYRSHWSELRFARHEAMASKPWPDDQPHGWPVHVSSAPANPMRIVCKHYCYRSPSQMELRIATRKAAKLNGVFQHEDVPTWIDPMDVEENRRRDLAYRTDSQLFEDGWRSRIIPTKNLEYDARDGNYVVNEHLMPPMPSEPYRSIKDDAVALMRRAIRSLTGRPVAA